MLHAFWRPNREVRATQPGRFGPAHISWFNLVMEYQMKTKVQEFCTFASNMQLD